MKTVLVALFTIMGWGFGIACGTYLVVNDHSGFALLVLFLTAAFSVRYKSDDKTEKE
jgi:hypothetical protein